MPRRQLGQRGQIEFPLNQSLRAFLGVRCTADVATIDLQKASAYHWRETDIGDAILRKLLRDSLLLIGLYVDDEMIGSIWRRRLSPGGNQILSDHGQQ